MMPAVPVRNLWWEVLEHNHSDATLCAASDSFEDYGDRHISATLWWMVRHQRRPALVSPTEILSLPRRAWDPMGSSLRNHPIPYSSWLWILRNFESWKDCGNSDMHRRFCGAFVPDTTYQSDKGYIFHWSFGACVYWLADYLPVVQKLPLSYCL